MFTTANQSQGAASSQDASAAWTPFLNLATPSQSGGDDVDQLNGHLALDDIKPPLLPPNKRRKVTPGSPEISGERVLSSSYQGSSPFGHSRSTRVSTQLLTRKSNQLASRGLLGTRSANTSSVLNAYVRAAAAPGPSAYRANADELELWTDAEVSPIVFGQRTFAKRLSEEEFKSAVTFNLRHLFPEIEEPSDAQRPMKRPSLAATAEKSRKNHISSIIEDALGIDGQAFIEEIRSGFSTDVPNDHQEGIDTPADTTDTDDCDLKVAFQPSYKTDSRSTHHNTYSLSFQKPRRSLLAPIRRTPTFSPVNTQKSIVSGRGPSDLPDRIPLLLAQDSTRSPTPHIDGSIHSAPSSPGSFPQNSTDLFPKQVFQEPFLILDEDFNIVHSPPARSLSPLHQDVTMTDSQQPHDSPSNPPLSRSNSTSSSLFGPTEGVETTIESTPPQLEEATHKLPPSSAPLSEDDPEIPSESLAVFAQGPFFQDCPMQILEDASNASATTQDLTFRGPKTGPSSQFPDGTSWPSPAAPEDHPYLQEARNLMVIAKLRQDVLPYLVEEELQGIGEDGHSGNEGESEIEDADEFDERGDSDAIESEGTDDELDTLSVVHLMPVASGSHNNSLLDWDAHNMIASRHGHGLHRVDGWESISTSRARAQGSKTGSQSTRVAMDVLATIGRDHDSDIENAEDGDDQINREDQLEDWTASLQTLVKGKRVLPPEELLNLKTVLNAVHTHSSTISPSSDLAQTVLQVAKLETKDIPNQDSLGLRGLARKSLRAWGLSTRTK